VATRRPRPSASLRSFIVSRKASASSSIACASSRRAPVRQWIVDVTWLAKRKNIAIVVQGVSLSLRGPGRLHTRLDTPPISLRHHAFSRIALNTARSMLVNFFELRLSCSTRSRCRFRLKTSFGHGAISRD
jgi:hypothetical protein